MKKFIPRIFKFQGFETTDLKEWLSEERIEIYLKPVQDMKCFRCGTALKTYESSHMMKIRHLNIFGCIVFLILRRRKGFCPGCKKDRSEHIDFVSENSPHVTKEFSWFMSRLCEIASVSNAAKITGIDKMLAYRIDHRILIRLLGKFKIPAITRLSVDEVYARRKKKEGETRDDLFLTIITDLKTHKVIFVSRSRRKEALDRFFILIGKEACKKIKVVACDQHEAYKNSVEEYCRNAVVVWDRFHLMKNFNEAVNEARKTLFNKKFPDDVRRSLHGRYRFIFLKRASQRSKEERDHVKELMEKNQEFFLLEIIKETFIKFFDSMDEKEAGDVWEELGLLIFKLYDRTLVKWYHELNKQLSQLLLYFEYRVTTSVSEGINNVIKMLKRNAFGYKDMEYFGLKIMQKCGYLNSEYISCPYS